MDEQSRRELRDRVARSSQELQAAAGSYSRIISQLEELGRQLDAGDVTEVALSAVRTTLLSLHESVTLRGATPIDDGLSETRTLFEVLNRIVLLSKKRPN